MAWTIIHIIDILLWLFFAGSVAYVAFFAVCSLFRLRRPQAISDVPSPDTIRFLVLFPAYQEDLVICNSVETFLQQDYPNNLYEVVVISDHMKTETNKRLSSLPITLLQPSFEKSSKAQALQFAMNRVSGTFSHVVILDADNVVEPDFLSRLANACGQGYQAIQCHRTAKNTDNDIAQLDGLSEEINNTLFRRAHNNIGLSSALIGSGMCFKHEWFARNVGLLSSAVEDRELEALLLRQNVFIKYEEDICVMDEKVSSQDNFQRQRQRWMTGQIQALLQMLPYLPTALLKCNANYADKTIQQMLIPRSMLLVSIPSIALLMTVLSPVWSVKWWCMLVCLCTAIIVAIPTKLRTSALLGKFSMLPRLVWRMTVNLFHIKRHDKEFIHTSHDK